MPVPVLGIVRPAARLVAEAAFLADGAALEVVDRAVDVLGGDRAPRRLRRAEGHDLPAGDADVAVAAGRLVPPAAGVVRVLGQVLRQEDQLHGAGQGRAAPVGQRGVGGHADDLGEHQGADAVAIHRAVARVRDDQAVGRWWSRT